MTHEEKAKALFLGGYNCSQSVVAAFSDVTGLDEKTALMLASPFGGGMGRMREVCGAVSGMLLVLGALYGVARTENNAQKAELYARVQELSRQYREQNGSIICRELLSGEILKDKSAVPEERTPEYYKKRPCAELVACAAKILDGYIKENPYK